MTGQTDARRPAVGQEHSRKAISGGGHDEVSVGTERDAVDDATMAAERCHLVAGRDVPDLPRPVGTRRGELGGAWAERGAEDLPPVPMQLVLQPHVAVFNTPDARDLVCARRDDQVPFWADEALLTIPF